MDISRIRHSIFRSDNYLNEKRVKFRKEISVFISIFFFSTSTVFADDGNTNFMEAELATTYDLSRDGFEERLKPLDFSLMGDSIDIGSDAIVLVNSSWTLFLKNFHTLLVTDRY
ncbi:hypothetical protein RC083_09440 [Pseudoalteromonas haloplanktis]|uniref:Uncharacterized protein n=1 Tax=Pseudoalteromonas haloplanktis TaxID=228 RepID=A0ABU1BBF8_PSEHA|nr:hypothetical protein [Pseudoalteromonas haloplanktis]MDQ9091815.1 hypothetical protein [Pseudoalteromonas haloplanktis]